MAEDAIHVGADRAGATVDRTFVRGGDGEPLIPGTSLAGALRAHLLATGAPSVDVDRWLGVAGSGEGDAAGASRLVVDDALVTGGTFGSEGMEVRKTTAIDPDDAVPAATALFSREVLPAGTSFSLSLELHDDSGPDGPGGIFLDQVISLLQGGITLGAATSRGLGRVVLSDVERLTVPLDSREGFLAFLTDPVWKPYGVDPARVVRGDSFVLGFEVAFRARGPMMSSVEVDGSVNRVPLTTAVGPGQLRLVLPGSGVKGALRSRARYVLATLGCADAEADDAFRLVFGIPRPDGPDASDGIYGRGRLRVHDVVSLQTVDSEAWREIRSPEEGEGEGDKKARRRQRRVNLDETLTRLGLTARARVVVADRVAVDRWTGGAAEGRLYSLLEPELEWSPIRVDLDLRGVDSMLARAAVGLLLLVVREIVDGWVPLGYATRRGLGQISVDTAKSQVSIGPALTDWRGFQPDQAEPGPPTLATVMARDLSRRAVEALTERHPSTLAQVTG